MQNRSARQLRNLIWGLRRFAAGMEVEVAFNGSLTAYDDRRFSTHPSHAVGFAFRADKLFSFAKQTAGPLEALTFVLMSRGDGRATLDSHGTVDVDERSVRGGGRGDDAEVSE